MIIDCIGCLHGHYPTLKGGDLLIVTGDLTAQDKVEQYFEFNRWLSNQKYDCKIVIAGNHDRLIYSGLDIEVKKDLFHKIIPIVAKKTFYLQDSQHEYEGWKIWGTPHSLLFPKINPLTTAFTGPESEIEEFFLNIPDNIDILVSHTPFYGMLDANHKSDLCGSRSLKEAIERIKPKLFVCSHIHEQGGQQAIFKHKKQNTICVNCSIMNEKYIPTNSPVRIVL